MTDFVPALGVEGVAVDGSRSRRGLAGSDGRNAALGGVEGYSLTLRAFDAESDLPADCVHDEHQPPQKSDAVGSRKSPHFLNSGSSKN